jgi:dipeptidyl aminopeptidase/acylaminoacyl peptidase
MLKIIKTLVLVSIFHIQENFLEADSAYDLDVLMIPKLSDGEQRVYFKSGGEWCYIWTPKSFKVNGKSPVLVHNHGARGYIREGAADWPDTEWKAGFLKAIMENGIVIAGSHACGDHWGNPCAVKANEALLADLDANPSLDTSRLGLMGGGLGGALVWNSVLGPYSERVKLVTVQQAVVNLYATIKEKKFRDVTLKAYGFEPEASDEEAYKIIGPSDPLPRLRKLKPGIKLPRVVIYHGAKDENIPAETNAIPLSEALKKAGADVELNVFPNVEHDVYGMGKEMEDRLKAFWSNL